MGKHDQHVPLTITIEREAFRIYEMSVGRRPPETYGVLAGYLDAPFHITDFRPMPPMGESDGTVNASRTHVQLNAPFIEHYLNNELIPAGKYLLGVWHSHPGRFSQLSDGREGDGDIPSMKGSLRRAAELGRPWDHFLAPLTNFGPDNAPEITGWVVTLKDAKPIPAHVVVAESSSLKADDSTQTLNFAVDEIIRRANVYQASINEIVRDKTSPKEDIIEVTNYLRHLRREELAFLTEKSRTGLARLSGGCGA